MLSDEEWKKRTRAIDLALSMGRKRQSPRTGFIHLSPLDETVSDLIPVYENFCFCLALFRQKTGECVQEGKVLMEKLLHFQTKEGNFPVFLHEYPHAWDFQLPLKIAPVLIYLLRDFGTVLGSSLKEKVELSLQKALLEMGRLRLEKTFSPLWELRYQACTQGTPFSLEPLNQGEWLEYLITLQLFGEEGFFLPYHRKLQLLVTHGMIQEKGEPRPSPIEWLLAEEEGYSPRLLQDHFNQLYIPLLAPIAYIPEREEQDWIAFDSSQGFHLLWKGKTLHSLLIRGGKVHEIPSLSEPVRGDLFEVEAFCDLASSVSISGKKGTVFQLGEWIEIESGGFKVKLRFLLQEGEGEFCGHISRGNRPSQIACKGSLEYETYDWRIALRTLRKSTPCTIYTEVVPFFSSEELSTAIPIA